MLWVMYTTLDYTSILPERTLNRNPQNCRYPVLVPDNSWGGTATGIFFPKKSSVETLEKDPDIVRRMEENDVALDPAFFVGVHDASGFELYAVQGIDQTAAKESLQDWQKYIRETVHGKKPSSTFHVPMGD